MTKFLLITDQHSKIFGHRLLNSQLSLYIGALQLLICVWSLTQHVFSIVAFDKVSTNVRCLQKVLSRQTLFINFANAISYSFLCC